LSDEEILQRYKVSGKSEYFGELYNRYLPELYGVGLKYLHNAEKVQNAIMHLFTNLLSGISQYDNIDIFRTWIYSVMKNHCLQILQAENPGIMLDSCPDEKEFDEVLYLFNEEEETERKKTLKQCLKKLPVEQRIAVIRFFMEEMSYQDIADSTGYNLKQVKSYIQNGKLNLKNCMKVNS
jgi:RNA polymerase sigma-70 factor (ECF subfamily)